MYLFFRQKRNKYYVKVRYIEGSPSGKARLYIPKMLFDEEVALNGKVYRRGTRYPTLLVAEDGTVIGPKGKPLVPQVLNQAGHLAVGVYYAGKRGPKMVYVHRLVALAWIENPDNLPQVDHVYGDVTDNRASRLRWVDNRINCFNNARRREHRTTSVYYGVTKNSSNSWIAQITINGRTMRLLSSQDEEACARAYDAALIEVGYLPKNFITQ
jgi:hypothetical protein